MLTVRTQAIDGTGTFTLSDSQPCRLLTLLHGRYPASTLLRGSPPLSGASVLSASQLAPLVPFRLASPARFSRSIRQPDRASRCLHAGCRSVGIRTSTELIPEDGSAPGFDITYPETKRSPRTQAAGVMLTSYPRSLIRLASLVAIRTLSRLTRKSS